MHKDDFGPQRLGARTAADAREAVELAMGFDRSATRLTCAAEAVTAAHLAMNSQLGTFASAIAAPSWGPLQVGAQAFAASYRQACRDNLAAALDTLTWFGQAHGAELGTSAADVVIAEAGAIAAAAESELAAERHAEALNAARDAEQAVAAAALTVARAAETARLAREDSNRLAAASVAATASRAALEVQTRAAEVAVATSAAAHSATQTPAQLGGDRISTQKLAALVLAAAAAKAAETAHAASIVAQAVESAATAVAVLNEAAEAATRNDVRDAARTVQAVANAAAREVAAATTRAEGAAARRTLHA